MSDDDMKPSDRLYYGIAALDGWGESLRLARDFQDAYSWRIGSLLSSILLAGGEENEPVAVTGALDDEGDGKICVVYPDLLVVVAADKLSARGGEVTVSPKPLSAARDLKVATRHNYYNGTKSSPRQSGIVVELSIGDNTFTLPSSRFGESPLTQDAAAFAALTILRERSIMADAGKR